MKKKLITEIFYFNYICVHTVARRQVGVKSVAILKVYFIHSCLNLLNCLYLYMLFFFLRHFIFSIKLKVFCPIE